MRLIDADELTSDLLDQIPNAENVHIFKNIIESQKTAYDIEKVLERLEKHFNATDDRIERLCYHHAIKIVKCEKENKEMKSKHCKWVTGAFSVETCWGDIDIKLFKRFKKYGAMFCPYCGRKIEVK